VPVRDVAWEEILTFSKQKEESSDLTRPENQIVTEAQKGASKIAGRESAGRGA